MPKKDDIKKEVELKTHTLTEAERKGVDVKSNETAIQWQTKGVYFGLLILLVVVIAGVVTWIFKDVFFVKKVDKGHVVFTVNGKKFYSKDIEAMQAEAKTENVDSESSLNIIIDTETKRAAAESLNIKVSDNKYLNNTSDWQKTHSYPAALDSEVKEMEIGGYDISLFLLNFSRLQLYPNGLNVNNKPEGWRDAQAIAQDRAYAESKAKSYREKLSNKQITAEQAIDEIRKDPRLSSGASSNKSVIAVVDETGSVQGAGQSMKLDRDNWMADVKKLTAGQYTEIKVGKINLFDLPNNPNVDGYFYFVGLNKKLDAQPGLTDKLNQAIKQVKVERM